MAKKSLSAENARLEKENERVRVQIVKIKRERTMLAAWVHQHDGNVEEICAIPAPKEQASTDLELF